MARLFVGLEVPEQARLRLSLVGGPLPGARWIDAADMHVTLRFVGDIANPVADELVGFLDQIEARAFSLTIRDIGAFGGREPRVIWAGAEGGEPLMALQRAVERAARSAGLEPETQTFKPHVTLARLRGTRPDHVGRFLASRSRLALEPFPVERFVLFSSRPHSGGGPYVTEAVFPLAHARD